ncbi:MAG: protein kinase [Candidatus Eisenbacteria bacterium]
MERERWRRVREVLADALEVEPEERDAYLAAVCGNDSELEAELRVLLDADRLADAKSASWTDGIERLTVALSEEVLRDDPLAGAVDAAEGGPKWDAGVDADEDVVARAGTRRVGRYPLLEELGRGGTGIVYRAYDPKLDRLVAIKLLSGSRLEGSGLSRVLREARNLARFNHPNIATIYSLDHTAEGESFLVLELVEGETLATRRRSGPAPLDEVIGIAVRIARALAAAHQRGIVHRDLKPHNVMLDAEGTVKVLDFGLAKDADDLPGDRSPDDGSRSGTIGYMSPEQVLGRSVDARTDVYSFGLVLFECLTDGKALEAGRIRWERLPRGLPESVRALLRKCLAHDRTGRYRDMTVVLPILEEILQNLDTDESQARVERREIGRSRVPRPVSSFVGRREELDALDGLVSETRLLTLTGPGGMGKTRLAIELAESVTTEFPDGVVWVTLTWLGSGDQLRAALASGFGLGQSQRLSDARLRDGLAGKRSLLVLDGCEHLTDACQTLLSRLLPECPSLHVVATSLGRLDVPGEVAYAVPSLRREDAIALFEKRARESRPGFRAVGAAADDVAEICRRLDGLPLGIELAAARLRAMSIGAVRNHLQSASRTVAGRVSETFSWGYELLGMEARQLLCRLSVFAGGWSLESAEEICADDVIPKRDILESLTALVEKSFVVYELETQGDNEGRYRMLKTIRDFAADKLGEFEEPARLRQVHLQHFLALAERAAASLNDPDQKRWLDLLETEHENLLEASAYACGDGGEPDLGLRLVLALSWFWQHHAHYEIARVALNQAIEQVAPEGSRPQLAQMRLALGRISSVQGDPTGAEHHYLEARALADADGDSQTLAVVCLDLAMLRMDVADWDGAETLLSQAEQAFPEQSAGRARTHSLRARMAHHLGHLETARTEYEAALELYRSVGDQRAVAGQLNGLADIVSQSGDFSRAEAMWEECLRIGREQGLHQGVAATLVNLADLAANRGDWPMAWARMEEGLVLARRIGHRRATAAALASISSYHVLHSNFVDAAATVAEGLSITGEIGLNILETHLVGTVSLMARADGDDDLAAYLAAGAAEMRKTLGAPPDPRIGDASDHDTPPRDVATDRSRAAPFSEVADAAREFCRSKLS